MNDFCTQINCSMYTNCKKVKCKTSSDTKNIDLLFIVDSVSSEASDISIFDTDTTSIFGNMINRLKLKFKFSYGIVPLIRNSLPKTKGTGKNKDRVMEIEPKKQDVTCCLKNLKKDLKKYKPKIIITFGNNSAKFLCGYDNVESNMNCVRILNICGKEYPTISSLDLNIFRSYDVNLIGMPYKAIYYALLYINNIDLNIKTTIKSKLLTSIEGIEKALKKLSKSKYIGVDTETRNLNLVYDSTLLSIQLANEDIGYVIPISHFDSPFSPVEIKKIGKLLKVFFKTKSEIKGFVFHNAVFDLSHLLTKFNIFKFSAPTYDTMLGASFLDENLLRFKKVKYYSLDHQAWNRGFTLYRTNEKMSKDKRTTLTEIPIKDWKDYAAADAIIVVRLLLSYIKEAKCFGYNNYLLSLTELSNASSNVITYVQNCGMQIDIDELRNLFNPRTSSLLKAKDEVVKEFNKLKSVKLVMKSLLKQETGASFQLFSENCGKFDPSKRNHKEALFFNHLKLEPTMINEKSGESSLGTDFKSTYKEIPEVELLRQYERIKQLFGLYIESFMKKVSKISGTPDFYNDYRIRPKFSISTVTGRLSSHDPNGQQRVSRGDRAETILNMFKASKGRVIVKLDYRAHEVRGLQIISGDTQMEKNFNNVYGLRKDFRDGKLKFSPEELKAQTDVHVQNTATFFKIDPLKVTKEQRNKNKGLIFGLSYGMSDSTLAKSLKIVTEEATKLRALVFSKIKQAKKWLDDIGKKGQKDLYVESPLGKIRHLWGFLLPSNSKNKFIKSKVSQLLRLCMNSNIQEMCSNFSIISIKLFLDHIRKLKKAKYQCEEKDAWLITNLVHDSAEFDIPVKDLFTFMKVSEPYFTSKLKEYLIKVFNMKINVEFEVDYEIGFSLNKMTKWNGTQEHLKLIYDSLKK